MSPVLSGCQKLLCACAVQRRDTAGIYLFRGWGFLVRCQSSKAAWHVVVKCETVVGLQYTSCKPALTWTMSSGLVWRVETGNSVTLAFIEVQPLICLNLELQLIAAPLVELMDFKYAWNVGPRILLDPIHTNFLQSASLI
jgi:hypothetical protein